MTTDERLDRLTVIVEALVNSVERHDKQIEALIRLAEKRAPHPSWDEDELPFPDDSDFRTEKQRAFEEALFWEDYHDRNSEEKLILTEEQIAEENVAMECRQDAFRQAAELVAAEFGKLECVHRVSLFGSVHLPLRKEVTPRKHKYHKARVKLLHECRDADLAVWISHLNRLAELRSAIDAALTGKDVSPQLIDVHFLDASTGIPLGRLCHVEGCPAGKPACNHKKCRKESPRPGITMHATFDKRSKGPKNARVLFDRSGSLE
jgi:hypothetical protein